MLDFGSSLEPLMHLLLMLCRTASFLMMTPLLRRLPVPPLVAMGLVVLTAIALQNSGMTPDTQVGADLGLIVVVVLEIAIGMALGLVTLVIFEAFRVAGQAMGLSMGLAMATLMDPGEKTQMSALATIYGMFAALLFVLMDGHHMLFRTLAMSYQLAPVGAAHFPTGVGHALASMLAASFALGIRIAAPVLAGQLLCDMTAGILGKSIPRLPIFFVIMPVKMLISYGVTIITMPALSILLDNQMVILERNIHLLLRGT